MHQHARKSRGVRTHTLLCRSVCLLFYGTGSDEQHHEQHLCVIFGAAGPLQPWLPSADERGSTAPATASQQTSGTPSHPRTAGSRPKNISSPASTWGDDPPPVRGGIPRCSGHENGPQRQTYARPRGMGHATAAATTRTDAGAEVRTPRGSGARHDRSDDHVMDLGSPSTQQQLGTVRREVSERRKTRDLLAPENGGAALDDKELPATCLMLISVSVFRK